MAKYVTIRIRRPLQQILQSAQRPAEPISDTIASLLDPMRIQERQAERQARPAPAPERGG